MSIVEPLYLATYRVPKSNGIITNITSPVATTDRKQATRKALKMCKRGHSMVVYECRIVEVHHPTKKARRERKERLRRKKRRE